jgi:general nucleoside transport system ATP-binding protein
VSGVGSVMLDAAGIERRTRQVIRDFDVRPPNPLLPARALSGGNQQKLIIGREFELPPTALLVSQPTRGVDIGAIEFIHKRIVALRDSGKAVLLVSVELDEIMALSDRILVVCGGRITGERRPEATNQQDLGLLMAGVSEHEHAA